MADNLQVAAYLDRLWLERGLSKHTLAAYGRDLDVFCQSLERQGLTVSNFSTAHLLDFLADRQQCGLSARSVARLLSSIRGFTDFLIETHLRADNPARKIDPPKLPKPLPKTLTESQVEALLAAPKTATAVGLRDKAFLELLYASGLRVSELVELRAPFMDLNRGLVRVLGKGQKERLVPMGEEALHWMREYLAKARGELAGAALSDFVFPGRKGAMTRQSIWHRVKHNAQLAGVPDSLSPHGLRHAFATHLLNHGVDLRSVQLLLGHSDLSTTQIYTQVAQARLAKLHEQHHPRGHL